MTSSTTSSTISSPTGAWRKPRNTAAHQAGGIHDDATATTLGFRGGTVAGAIHMEQFPPLLESMFGAQWWQTGTLSTYFRNATLDLEPVQCHVASIDTDGELRRASVHMENEAGETVLEGTASVGGRDRQSMLSRKLAEVRPAGEIRILEPMQVGDRCAAQTVSVSNAHLDEQLSVITEPLECYTAPDRFGGRVLPATQVVRAIRPAEVELSKQLVQPYVGLYGAIEIAFVDGPVLAETDYQVTGEVVAISDSPKTEILWWTFDINAADRTVARVIKMDRIMKASSKLWAS